jgi:hypothetical protein
MVPEKVMSGVTNMVLAMANNWRRFSEKRKREKVFFVAVDATLELISIIVYAEDGGILLCGPLRKK